MAKKVNTYQAKKQNAGKVKKQNDSEELITGAKMKNPANTKWGKVIIAILSLLMLVGSSAFVLVYAIGKYQGWWN